MFSLAIRRWCFWNKHNEINPPQILFYMVDSALAREDEAKAESYVHDWLNSGKAHFVQISKFVPGVHFYVLGKKFDTIIEAKDHATKLGYNVSPDILRVMAQ